MSDHLSVLCEIAVLPNFVHPSRLCSGFPPRIGPEPAQCFLSHLNKLSACLFAQAVTARLVIKSQHGQGRQGDRVLWCVTVLESEQCLIHTAQNAELGCGTITAAIGAGGRGKRLLPQLALLGQCRGKHTACAVCVCLCAACQQKQQGGVFAELKCPLVLELERPR